MNTTRRQALTRIFPVLVAAFILVSQLLAPPIVGLADNADYVNVTGLLQLAPAKESDDERYFFHIVPLWKVDPARQEFNIRLITSEWALILPLVSTLLPLTGFFDLRWAGAMHTAVFLWALWLIAPAIQKLGGYRQLLVWGTILLLFCDVAYFALFNSLYMDAAAFVFLMLAAAFYVRVSDGGHWLHSGGFLLALFFFVTSKLQHAILVVPVVVFLLLDKRLRTVVPFAARAAVCIAMLLAVYGMFQHVPEDYKGFAAYNVIFRELLPQAEKPEQTLEEFGLPQSMVQFRGSTSFPANSGIRDPRFRSFVLERATHEALFRYYVRHPGMAWHMIRLALRASAEEREPGYGNFARETGKAPRSVSHAYAVVSDLRSTLFRGSPLFYGVYMISIAGAATWLAMRRWPGALNAVILILTCAAIEFFVSALGDCEETTRHLFLFRALMDLALVGAVVGQAVLPAKG